MASWISDLLLAKLADLSWRQTLKILTTAEIMTLWHFTIEVSFEFLLSKLGDSRWGGMNAPSQSSQHPKCPTFVGLTYVCNVRLKAYRMTNIEMLPHIWIHTATINSKITKNNNDLNSPNSDIAYGTRK